MDCHAQTQNHRDEHSVEENKVDNRVLTTSHRRESTAKTYVSPHGGDTRLRAKVQTIQVEAVRERKQVQRLATDTNGTPILSRD